MISIFLGDATDLIPRFGKIPWRRAPCTQYSCLGESMDRRRPARQQSIGSHRVRHDWKTTEHEHIICIYIWGEIKIFTIY